MVSWNWGWCMVSGVHGVVESGGVALRFVRMVCVCVG